MLLAYFEILNSSLLRSKIVLWDEYIRCNPYLLILDVILFLHFIVSWYLSYKKDGFKIDIWHVFVFKLFILPFFLLYPFNGSIYNYVSTGHHLFSYYKHIDLAFLITTIGYIAMYIGRHIANLNSKRSFLEIIFMPFEKMTENNIKNNISYHLLMFVGNFLILFVIYEQITNDVLFNPRAFFLKEHNLRPIYNVTLAIYPLLLVYVGTRFISDKSIKNGIIFSIHFVLSFFLGTRTSLLEPLLILVVLFYGTSPQFFTLRKIIGMGAIFLFLTFASVLLRSGSNAKNIKFERDLFHGNTYSDNRDFGWVLDKWNGQYLLGRTYVAGIMSLIPRKYSKFREKWAIGIYTSKIIGYNYKYFAGLRLGFFGEIFINFGIAGVTILGLILGYVLKKMDSFLKNTFRNEKDGIKAYAGLFAWNFIICLNVSNNFGALYSLVMIVSLMALIRQSLGFVSIIKKQHDQ
jgi:hypothetical protein